MSEPVILAEVPVMYVESGTGLAGASQAFDLLEARFLSLRGRKFYGTFERPAGRYRACTAIKADDDVPRLELKTWVVPGGKYRRQKLLDWQTKIADIGKTFESMAMQGEPDPDRPGIEYYRSQKELVLFLPVK